MSTRLVLAHAGQRRPRNDRIRPTGVRGIPIDGLLSPESYPVTPAFQGELYSAGRIIPRPVASMMGVSRQIIGG